MTAEQMGRRVDLPGEIREKMESSFGADFSGVRLYESDTVASAGAEAVAQGANIAFAPGKLDFTSTAGQALLGHELSHVVSQARGESAFSGPVTPVGVSAAAAASGPMQAKKHEQEYTEKAQLELARRGSQRDISTFSYKDRKILAELYDKDRDNKIEMAKGRWWGRPLTHDRREAARERYLEDYNQMRWPLAYSNYTGQKDAYDENSQRRYNEEVEKYLDRTWDANKGVEDEATRAGRRTKLKDYLNEDRSLRSRFITQRLSTLTNVGDEEEINVMFDAFASGYDNDDPNDPDKGRDYMAEAQQISKTMDFFLSGKAVDRNILAGAKNDDYETLDYAAKNEGVLALLTAMNDFLTRSNDHYTTGKLENSPISPEKLSSFREYENDMTGINSDLTNLVMHMKIQSSHYGDPEGARAEFARTFAPGFQLKDLRERSRRRLLGERNVRPQA